MDRQDISCEKSNGPRRTVLEAQFVRVAGDRAGGRRNLGKAAAQYVQGFGQLGITNASATREFSGKPANSFEGNLRPATIGFLVCSDHALRVGLNRIS